MDLEAVVPEETLKSKGPAGLTETTFPDMPPIPKTHKRRSAVTPTPEEPETEIIKEDPMMTYATWGMAGAAGVGVIALVAYCACKGESGPPKRARRM